ncbi:hypothetical protein [Pseudonocardia sp. NPDC049635]|uniref:hypothetical protein n=1 Tax=Pseudonocardia sp. NPDC049635 TaxID=3155506 RepID=UPI0033ED589F
MIGPGPDGLVFLAVVLVLLVVVLMVPAGRRAASAALRSVRRLPGLIRAELRGSPPLRPDTGRDDTTPEIPVVDGDRPAPTRTFPQVGRPER